jgi:hypothetical protein
MRSGLAGNHLCIRAFQEPAVQVESKAESDYKEHRIQSEQREVKGRLEPGA